MSDWKLRVLANESDSRECAKFFASLAKLAGDGKLTAFAIGYLVDDVFEYEWIGREIELLGVVDRLAHRIHENLDEAREE